MFAKRIQNANLNLKKNASISNYKTITNKGAVVNKLMIVLIMGCFGLVGFGFAEGVDSSLESKSDLQAESNAEVNAGDSNTEILKTEDLKDSKVEESKAQADSKAKKQAKKDSKKQAKEETKEEVKTESSTDSNVAQSNVESSIKTNAESSAESSTESKSDSSTQATHLPDSSTQVDSNATLQGEFDYPNSDWEVSSEMADNSEWGKKQAQCNSANKSNKEQDKCKASQATKLHSLCKSKGDKYCVLKVALFGGNDRLIEDIDVLYKSCDKGYGSACTFYGMGVGNMGDKANEIRLYEKACELGSAMGCFGVGGAYFEKSKDAQKAKPYIDKAIDLGDNGCKKGFDTACKWLDNVRKVKAEVELQIQTQNNAQENADKNAKKSKKPKK